MSNFNKYRQKLERLKGERQVLRRDVKQHRTRMKELWVSISKHEEAREILREAGLQTQRQLQFHISDITSLAMEAVFTEPYQLKVDFVERRNKTECDLWFERDGDLISPLEASGGGAVDVAAFALRVACYSMTTPKTNPVIILDEPMRFLSRDNQKRASIMVKELSQKLGVQFIIVTHEPTLTEAADRVFEVKKLKDKPSQVVQYDQEVM